MIRPRRASEGRYRASSELFVKIHFDHSLFQVNVCNQRSGLIPTSCFVIASLRCADCCSILVHDTLEIML